MYDIHHHLLYGLDDGPRDIEASVAQARMAAEDGITHIVCTPHASSSFPFRPEENARRVAEISERMGGAVTLGLGCDFHLSYDNIEDALANPSKYTVNGGQYLLIEFPDFGIPPQITEAMYELRVHGLTLVITHPERNPTLQTRPAMLADWLRAGHLIQVTAGALDGKFGRTAQRTANELLAKHWVHFLATDAHDTERRPPKLRAAHELVARSYGRDYADLLCIANPKAVFNNAELPEQLEMLEVFDDELPKEKKKGLFSRFFSPI